ncbi:RagB/SusD family nutrient uptake outer membrane protein [Pedobacter sp. LMG 31464]|uniref:RagB/SusD family nutrient uptake outer membrane protein n=1 Tax=Pedobacter planticolens TaxID=2679964 RepID=A0A923DXE2_9SPHI|nr:RagB/SusD family nutrient uptake outer membrane protein [Pedobacter planticolens]MBB2145804.1 RagB/SusD family nutrient uptake outer membrane protein [Pedobacter planticolens]
MKNKIFALIGSGLLFLTSCEKYLDKKSDQKLVVPQTVAELQAVLDDNTLFNQNEPNAVIVAADEYQLSYAAWQGLNEFSRNMYIWAPALQFASTASDNWSVLYTQVYRANVVLTNLPNVAEQGFQEWRNVKGQALMLRSKAFFQALMIWTVGYQASTSANEPGIPIRLDVNFNTTSIRSAQKECFLKVIDDLRESAALLPDIPVHPIRPSKPAAYGYLARTFLAMGMADSCLKYTNLALALKGSLMDYNGGPGVNPTAEYPFARFNPEVIYDTYMGHPTSVSNGVIDPELYNSYAADDLRKVRFHRSSTSIGYFKGSYYGTFDLFNGIATDELYLNRAECYARLGDKTRSIEALNTLLLKRFKTGTFQPYTAIDSEEALKKVLTERKKELVFRGLRWMDLKRLNADGADITLKRVLSGKEYMLLPNDRGYAMPIPEKVISTSGMAQNLR